MKLTDTHLRNLKPSDKVQKLTDGGGLYCHIAPSGGKLWRLAYRFNGKQKLLSLGAYPAVSLKDARQRREEARELLAKGIDPGEHKKEQKAAALAKEREEHDTFQNVALEWFAGYAPTLSLKHAAKLTSFLHNKLFPALGNKPVADIEPRDIFDTINVEVGKGHIETSHKLVNLCNQVLRYARLTGRVKYNVAAGLTEALPPVQTTHLPGITEPKEVGKLLRDIDAYDGYFSIAYLLKILPYVFTRPSELRRAEWPEFDFEKEVWTIPADRMKMKKEHKVPLSRQVIALLRELKVYSGDGKYLFPGVRSKSKPISDAGPLVALRNLGYTQDKLCLHGFRTTASTNLNELGFRYDVIEVQLAHQEQNTVREAYNRAEYMKERKDMMQKWADYLVHLKGI